MGQRRDLNGEGTEGSVNGGGIDGSDKGDYCQSSPKCFRQENLYSCMFSHTRHQRVSSTTDCTHITMGIVDLLS